MKRIINRKKFLALLAIFAITGLVAYYPFNGNANDESGNGNNGTVTMSQNAQLKA